MKVIKFDHGKSVVDEKFVFIGIDPGKTGSITVNYASSNSYAFHPMDLNENKLDAHALFYYLTSFDLYTVVCYIEEVHSIFGVSARSNFSFGEVYGGIKSVLECCGIGYELVQPKEWQKEMHKGIEKNKDKKVMSLQAAQKLFPDMDFKRTERCTTPDHNLIDSLLICEYGKRKYYESRP